jgi:hypothetical protein
LLLVDEFSQQRLKKLELQVTDLFQPTEEIVNSFVKKHTNTALVLKDEYEAIEKLYDGLEEKARSIDITLVASVGAERKRALKSIGKLEHKYLKAEKKKFAWQGDQIRQLRSRLFPGNSLQERKENFMPWYAQEGHAFLDRVYKALKPVTDQFIILEE